MCRSICTKHTCKSPKTCSVGCVQDCMHSNAYVGTEVRRNQFSGRFSYLFFSFAFKGLSHYMLLLIWPAASYLGFQYPLLIVILRMFRSEQSSDNLLLAMVFPSIFQIQRFEQKLQKTFLLRRSQSMEISGLQNRERRREFCRQRGRKRALMGHPVGTWGCVGIQESPSVVSLNYAHGLVGTTPSPPTGRCPSLFYCCAL